MIRHCHNQLSLNLLCEMAFDSQILRLQTNLSRLGFTPGRLDGWWGEKTAAAAMEAGKFYGVPTATPQISKHLELEVQKTRELVQTLEPDEFRFLFPQSKYDSVDDLNAALIEGVLTKRRAAAFLAQLGHESHGLKYWVELASGAAYENRKSLGNTQPGDGKKYKGRSPIQLTGRFNYSRFGHMLNVDLINEPQRAADPDVGFRISVAYWTDRNLNGLADLNNFREITRQINGGYNGWEDRQRWWKKIRDIWGL